MSFESTLGKFESALGKVETIAHDVTNPNITTNVKLGAGDEPLLKPKTIGMIVVGVVLFIVGLIVLTKRK